MSAVTDHDDLRAAEDWPLAVRVCAKSNHHDAGEGEHDAYRWGACSMHARVVAEVRDLLAEHPAPEPPSDEAREALARVKGVHEAYFDLDEPPGFANPEPEDVWRFDRDFRAALRGGDDQ